MIAILRCSALVLFCAALLAAPSYAAEAFPKDELTEEARSLYNGGKYQKALKLFIKLSHRYPSSRPVYRALAASANNAKPYETAVRAYEIYLQLNPSTEDADKAKAELENVRKLAKGDKDARWKSIESAVKNLKTALKNARLHGKNGAVSLLQTLITRQYFGPKFGEYQTAVWQLLRDQQNLFIESYWDTNQTLDVEILTSLIDTSTQASQLFARQDQIASSRKVLDIMALYNDGKYKKALSQLEGAPIRDYRLRYLMAMLLYKQKRAPESIALLIALNEQYQKPRALVRAEQIRLNRKRRIKDEDLDRLVEALDELPEPVTQN